MKTLILNLTIVLILSFCSAGITGAQEKSFFPEKYQPVKKLSMDNKEKKTVQYVKTKFGISGGVNFAKVKANDIQTAAKSGLELGVFIELYTSPNFSVTPGMKYLQGGSSFQNDITKISEKINYLTIPLSFNFKILTGNIQPEITGGLYYAFLLSAKQTQEYSSGENYEYGMKEFYKGSDYGLFAGAGISQKISKSVDVFINFNYKFGKKNISIYPGQFNLQNRGMELTAGFKFY